MAVRFDTIGENYTSTSSPPSGSAFTVVCWVKISTDRNTWSAAWSSDSSTSNYSYLATDSDGTTMKWWTIVGGSERTISGPNMSMSTWYRFGAVCNGTDATLYYGTASGALSTASAANWVTLSTSTTFRIGVDPFTDEWLNGAVAAVKHWSTNLTQAEIERELSQYAPDRTANLVRFHPFITNETVDYSGNARTLSGGSGTAKEDGPPIPWHAASPRLTLPVASAGSTVTLGQASETGTANALGRLKTRILGQPAEASSATALTRRKTRAIGQTSETDTAASLARSKTRILGQSTETDIAQAVTRAKRRSIGQTSETDTPTAVSRVRSRTLGQPAETDSPGAVSRSKTVALGRATEPDTAAALSRVKARVIGQPAEVSTAQVLSRAKRRTVGQSQETDTAQLVSQAGSIVVALGLGSETDTTQPLAHRKVKAFGQPSEVDSSQPLARQKTRAVGFCSESDIALTMARLRTKALAQPVETDAARTLTPLGAVVLRQVISTEIAAPLAKRLVLTRASEADSARTLVAGGESLPPFIGRTYRIGMSTAGFRASGTSASVPRISGAHSGGSSIRNPESL